MGTVFDSVCAIAIESCRNVRWLVHNQHGFYLINRFVKGAVAPGHHTGPPISSANKDALPQKTVLRIPQTSLRSLYVLLAEFECKKIHFDPAYPIQVCVYYAHTPHTLASAQPLSHPNAPRIIINIQTRVRIRIRSMRRRGHARGCRPPLSR